MKYSIAILVLATAFNTFATSANFKGSLGFETTRIQKYRRTDANTAGLSLLNSGEAIPGSVEDAEIQTYIFRLNPEIIVNDHVTVFSELSSGHARGGNIGGQGNVVNQGIGFGGKFYQSAPSSNDIIHLNQAYMDIYADIATFKVGRFSKHWGLGAVINNGAKAGDRFVSRYDGIEGNFNVGKLYITPYWAKIDTSIHHLQGSIRDIGVSVLYDDPNNDMKGGLLWSMRKSGSKSVAMTIPDATATTGSTILSESSVRMFNLFYKKEWKKFGFGIEIPYIDGDGAKNIYGSNTNKSIKSISYLGEAHLDLSSNFSLFLNGGYITGDSNDNTEFSAMYLNPNYNIAEIMFNYNLFAVENSGLNVHDAAITNATYAKLALHYKRSQWTWKLGVLWAQANETASAGLQAWQHDLGYGYTAAANQESDLGYEVDLSFDYQWNPNLILTGFLSYYAVGDYYAFNNTGSPLELENLIAGGLKLNLTF